MFFKKKSISTQVKKIDKLITGIIVGTAIVSMISLSRTGRVKRFFIAMKNITKNAFMQIYSMIGKNIIGIIDIFKGKK